MKTFCAIVTLSIASLALVTAAQAEGAGKFTVGVGYSNVKLGSEDFKAINVNGGYQFYDNFGVEGTYTSGIDNKTVLGAKVKLNYVVGVFGAGYWPVSENVDIIGRLGYGKGKVTASLGGFAGSGDESGVAYGVGVRYFPSGGNGGVRADFTRYDLGDDADTIQISYVRRF
jgi:hypothetical protein